MGSQKISENKIITCLKDIGCQQKDIDCFFESYKQQDINQQILVLKRVRCHLLEKTHQYQKKIDCLDYLICQIKNSQK
ncbi:MAG: hypothetical protein HFF37_02220 [Coprobacillus sp.]|nr:hypothetical protein [Coprobacillus sp.]